MPDPDYTAQAEALIRRYDYCADLQRDADGDIDPCAWQPAGSRLCEACAALTADIATALTAAHQAGARQALEGVRDHAPQVDLALCREMLSRVCDAVWHGHTGKHLWTIPVDESRDFDCLFMAAFDELERLRAQLAPPPHTTEDQGRASDRVADLVESVRQFKDFVEHGPGRREPDMTKFSSGRATPTTPEDAQS